MHAYLDVHTKSHLSIHDIVEDLGLIMIDGAEWIDWIDAPRSRGLGLMTAGCGHERARASVGVSYEPERVVVVGWPVASATLLLKPRRIRQRFDL